MASCESTGRERSFEWSHHRISCADSKVRLALQNSIKHSGSEGVNSHRQLEQGKEIFETYKSRISMIYSQVVQRTMLLK